MNPFSTTQQKLPERLILAAFALWTLLIVTIGILAVFNQHQTLVSIAYREALAAFHDDVTHRAWVAQQGGVYAPVSDQLPPNPYLAGLPDRDVTTTTGKELTLVNPAYMTRMVYEMGMEQLGVRRHLTSLNPIRPENAADAWESNALTQLAAGKKDVISVVQENGTNMLRFIAPLPTTQDCLKCHQSQGYKTGDVRGGISILVPLDRPELRGGQQQIPQFLGALSILWLSGAAGAGWARKSLRRNLKNQRDSEERFRNTFENAAVGIAHVAPDGRWLRMNARLCEIVGYSRDELLALTFADITHPEDLDADWCQAHRVLNGEIPTYTIEKRYIRKDKCPVWISLTVSLVRDQNHQPDYFISVVRDISDRKKAEQDRAAMEAHLRQAQKMQAIGKLAGGIAHDFNNILAALVLTVELLQHDQGLPPQIKPDLTEMKELIDRASSLTRQLLLFARQGVMQKKQLNLNTLLGNFTRMLRRLVGEHITLTLTHQPSGHWINADPGMIEQVVTNLVVNARDAMPNGGTIAISLEHLTLNSTNAENHADTRTGKYIRLSVTDTGHGMDKTTLENLFEPFFTTKEVGSGSGLGLATAQGIVQQHEGWITVESTPNQGSRFLVHLPEISAPEPDPAHATQTAKMPRGNETILLVEDESSLRNLTARLLTQQGYQVLIARHGQEAIQLLASNHTHIQLLITDIVMPEGLNGFELAEHLHAQYPNLPVLFTTGYSAPSLTNQFTIPSNAAILQKPCSPNDLLNQIRQLLDSSPTTKNK